jgi:hypothetical protein
MSYNIFELVNNFFPLGRRGGYGQKQTLGNIERKVMGQKKESWYAIESYRPTRGHWIHTHLLSEQEEEGNFLHIREAIIAP